MQSKRVGCINAAISTCVININPQLIENIPINLNKYLRELEMFSFHFAESHLQAMVRGLERDCFVCAYVEASCYCRVDIAASYSVFDVINCALELRKY